MVDVLAIGAHPDDVELAAGGTLCAMAQHGYTVGAVDLTEGEMGTRGTVQTRRAEASEASKILGIKVRVQLGLQDGNVTDDYDSCVQLASVIRRLRPRILLTHPRETRHTDHSGGSRLVSKACFLSGLQKIETGSEPWRPFHILHFEDVPRFAPSIIVDVSDVWEKRMQAIYAYSTQFFNPDTSSDEPETYVSNRGFMEWMEARARAHGHTIGARYGEAFLYHAPIGTDDLFRILHMDSPHR